MSDLEFAWLPTVERQHFTLRPFELATPPGVSRRPGRPGRVLLSAWAGDGVLRRLGRSSDDEARRAALALAEETGDPVIIGEVAGVVGPDFEPVYQAVGRVVMAKAVDPLSEAAWLQEVSRLSARMGVIAAQEAAHLTAEALEWLNFDWEDATGAQWSTARAGMSGTLRSPSYTMIRSQQVAITNALRSVVSQTGGAMARLPSIRPNLGAAFNLPDRRIAQTMAAHHGFWVRDQYGRISQSLARQAQPIIQAGISQGLSRTTIGKDLEARISGGLQMKGYWRTVAANHVTRARSYATGYTMRAAGITHYRIEAILDEATTETCLMLHDRVLPVDAAMSRQEAIQRDPTPDGVLWNQPFFREGDDELSIEFPDGRREVVATVVDPGRGTGVPGNYAGVMNSSQMVSNAIGFPPYHHNCRTTIIAETGPIV